VEKEREGRSDKKWRGAQRHGKVPSLLASKEKKGSLGEKEKKNVWKTFLTGSAPARFYALSQTKDDM